MDITPRQIALAQNSWLAVAADEGRAAQLFYEQLFEQHPSVKPMFSDNMTIQQLKFMAILTTVVESLGNLESIRGEIEDMGKRHKDYGALPEHYPAVGAVLVQTLSEILGSKFTPEVEEAWSSIYNRLADIMIEASDY